MHKIYPHEISNDIYWMVNNLNVFLFTEYLAAFRSFLKSEFSEENLEFWLACEDFKSTASPEDLHLKAEGIYQEFMQPLASREVSSSVKPGFIIDNAKMYILELYIY